MYEIPRAELLQLTQAAGTTPTLLEPVTAMFATISVPESTEQADNATWLTQLCLNQQMACEQCDPQY
jgi:hypothetical protein